MQCAMDASVLSHACTGMWCLRECAPESDTGLIPDMGVSNPPSLASQQAALIDGAAWLSPWPHCWSVWFILFHHWQTGGDHIVPEPLPAPQRLCL
jgi:hypothetical protein